jgi:hypothetical protein
MMFVNNKRQLSRTKQTKKTKGHSKVAKKTTRPRQTTQFFSRCIDHGDVKWKALDKVLEITLKKRKSKTKLHYLKKRPRGVWYTHHYMCRWLWTMGSTCVRILGWLYTHHLYNGLENVGTRAFKAITLEMPREQLD